MLISAYMQVLDMTKAASIAIIAVLILRLALKRLPKIIPYALWAVVLLCLLCPWSIEVPVSVMPEITPVEEQYTLADVPITPAAAAEAAYRAVGDALNGGLGIQHIRTGLPAEDGTGGSVATSAWWEVWILFGQYVWVAGILGMMIYTASAYVRLRRRLITTSPLRDNIYLADEIASPFVMGVFRPRIYLPSSLDARELPYILLHEQHHIHRGDHVIKLLAFIALSIHWFNPLVWVAFVLAGRDMEMSCDEAVVKKLGPDVLADYSASLLSLATGKRIIAGMPLAFGEGDTEGRIRNLASWKKRPLWVVAAAVVACVTLAGCLMTNPKEAPEQQDRQNEAAALVETGGFENIMGFSGHWVQDITWSHQSRVYYADTPQGQIPIGESFGYGIDDHVCDLDGDGVTELICNVTFGADGVEDVYVYRLRDGVVEEGCIEGDAVFPQADIWGAGAISERYDAEQKTFVMTLYGLEGGKQIHQQSDYANFWWGPYEARMTEELEQ